MIDYDMELLRHLHGNYMMTEAEKLQSSLRKEIADIKSQLKRHLETHCCHWIR